MLPTVRRPDWQGGKDATVRVVQCHPAEVLAGDFQVTIERITVRIVRDVCHLCGMLGMPVPCRLVELGSALGSPVDLVSKDNSGFPLISVWEGTKINVVALHKIHLRDPGTCLPDAVQGLGQKQILPWPAM